MTNRALFPFVAALLLFTLPNTASAVGTKIGRSLEERPTAVLVRVRTALQNKITRAMQKVDAIRTERDALVAYAMERGWEPHYMQWQGDPENMSGLYKQNGTRFQNTPDAQTPEAQRLIRRFNAARGKPSSTMQAATFDLTQAPYEINALLAARQQHEQHIAIINAALKTKIGDIALREYIERHGNEE